tara:strand:+ start:1830 stop:3773 length:1944 start_codon:yes stop_codon:yes gene_type:complete
MEFTTSGAILKLDNGEDIQVFQLYASEELSQVPTYTASFSSVDEGSDEWVGMPATLGFRDFVKSGNVEARVFEGIVTSVETRLDGADRHVDVTIKPVMAILELATFSRAYMDVSSLEVLEELFKRNGLDVTSIKKTKVKPAKRVAMVQFNENDLSFAQRILAEDGICFFPDTGVGPTLHDTKNPFPDYEGESITLIASGTNDPFLHRVSNISMRRTAGPDSVRIIGYNEENGEPDDSKALIIKPLAQSRLKGAKAGPQKTLFEAGMGPKSASKRKAIEMSRLAGVQKQLSGGTDHPGMKIGHTLKIESLSDESMAGYYVVTSLKYRESSGEIFCEFTAVDTATPPVPKLLPKPLIHGVHNAMVIGAAEGEPVNTASGHVPIRFFWDLEDEPFGGEWVRSPNKGKGILVRVSESFAGASYGSQFLPRSGQEVLVSFLHGDPDAPIITGQVYNGANKPPFAKAKTTETGITTKLKAEPNELVFDDKAGSERLALSATKDYFVTVANDESRLVQNNSNSEVVNDATLTVGGDLTQDITNTASINADEINLTATTKIVLKVGGSTIEMTSSGIEVNGTKIELSGTNVTAKAKSAMTIEGANTDVKAKSALGLEGLNLTAKGKIGATLEGGASATVKGSAIATIKGGVLKLN